jgi:hypothetical protein
MGATLSNATDFDRGRNHNRFTTEVTENTELNLGEN